MNESPLFRFYHGWRAAETPHSAEKEYLAARNRVACIDSSFRGRLSLTGKDGLDLLHRLSTNDLLALRPGGTAGTILTTEKGRVVDFVTVFHGGSELILLVSPRMEEAVSSWIEKFTIQEDVSVRSITDETAMVSFIGPEANSFISSLLERQSLSQPVASLAWGTIRVISLSRSNATEVHVVASAANAGPFWNWLQETCSVRSDVEIDELGGGVPLAGSQAYEGYRIAEGIPVTGAELLQSYNPYEVNLREFISYTKGCYIGQEVIARLDTYQKVRRQMAGLIFEPGAEVMRSGARVFVGSEEAGVVTSSTEEPLFGSRLGLTILRGETIVDGAPVICRSEGTEARATVRALPMRWPG